MNFSFLGSFFIIFIVSISAFTVPALAQKGGSPSAPPVKPKGSADYRILANYDYIMTSPGDLNSYRSQYLWNSTTATQGTFNNMNGFTIGAGYLLGNGFAGLEYSHAIQELPNTLITPTSTSVKDSLNYDTIYIVYDWLFNQGPKQSYELGLGVGQAFKYEYHNVLSDGNATEDVIWQATPVVFKLRANYNFHFSNNIRFRVGGTYENATSSSMKASTNHPTININGSPIISGQNLKYANGSDVKIDVSGLRLNVGLAVAF